MNFADLKNVLKMFDDHGWKGSFSCGEWAIANGGYDLWFELYYQDMVVAQCIDGCLVARSGIKSDVRKELFAKILEVYDHLQVDPEEPEKMLIASFEEGQEFYEKDVSRYFALAEEIRPWVWKIGVFDVDKEYLYQTTLHSEQLAHDILSGKVILASEVEKVDAQRPLEEVIAAAKRASTVHCGANEMAPHENSR